MHPFLGRRRDLGKHPLTPFGGHVSTRWPWSKATPDINVSFLPPSGVGRVRRGERGARSSSRPCGRVRRGPSALTRPRASSNWPPCVWSRECLARRTPEIASSPYFPHRSNRYEPPGPFVPSYARWPTSSANGSVYRAIRRGPASAGSKPTSRISSAATRFAVRSSPQHKRLGAVAQRPTSFCRCSGYRAPCNVIFEAALSISRRSSGVR
jgi:hypothetical protein